MERKCSQQRSRGKKTQTLQRIHHESQQGKVRGPGLMRRPFEAQKKKAKAKCKAGTRKRHNGTSRLSFHSEEISSTVKVGKAERAIKKEKQSYQRARAT